MKLTSSACASFILLTAVSITGCKTAPPPEAPQAMLPVEFRQAGKAGPIFRIQNRDNVVEVIEFARSLSAAGRYKEASEVFLDAADRFESASGNFEIDCKMAAVRELWLAGEFSKAHDLLDVLEREQDLYNRAGESEQIRRLRKLLKQSEALRRKKAELHKNNQASLDYLEELTSPDALENIIWRD